MSGKGVVLGLGDCGIYVPYKALGFRLLGSQVGWMSGSACTQEACSDMFIKRRQGVLFSLLLLLSFS